jgi:hypothetical protein
MFLPPSENARSEVADVTMVDRKPSRRCVVQVQVPLELCHEDRPRPKRHNYFETGHVRRRDVALFNERGVEELEEISDFIRVQAAVNVLAASRAPHIQTKFYKKFRTSFQLEWHSAKKPRISRN